MTRRSLFGACLAAFWFRAVHLWSTHPPYGYVDVSRAHQLGIWPCTVYLDGADVTIDCAAFDDEAGYVVLFTRNAHGKAYLDRETGCVAKQILVGLVTVHPGGAA